MRLFLAVDIPQPQKESIAEAIEPIRGVLALAGCRWTNPQSWHVTLKFLGEVPDDRVAVAQEIAAQAARRTPVTFSALADLGAFPSLSRPRVLWVGLSDPDHTLEHLAARMEKKFGNAGFRREARKLHPHVTLARFKERPHAGTAGSITQGMEANGVSIGDLLRKARPLALDRRSFPIEEVILFRSMLSPKGASYVPLTSFPFKND